tara:strand:+ start:2244 stop:2825 length:582 start_codon:yes stop_codon:yes gene_type:complete
MANYEATRYNFDGANLADVEGVNTGLILPWSDSTAPSGFLECNGATVSRSTYSALFAVIGTTYGSGNGSTTFTLPDLQDDIVVGKSPSKALASTGGANTVTAQGSTQAGIGNTTLTESTLPAHTHQPFPTGNNTRSVYGPGGMGQSGTQGTASFTMPNVGSDGAHNHTAGGNFTGDATSVLQPYLTIMYVIKT